MFKLSNAVPALKALDWARIGMWALVFVLWTGAVYMKGRDDEQEKQQQTVIADMERALERSATWAPRAAEIERDVAGRNARQEERGRKYEESVNQNQRPDSCNLSDDELRNFQALVEGR